MENITQFGAGYFKTMFCISIFGENNLWFFFCDWQSKTVYCILSLHFQSASLRLVLYFKALHYSMFVLKQLHVNCFNFIEVTIIEIKSLLLPAAGDTT